MFKVGDKVRVKNTFLKNYIGKIGTILSIEWDDICVSVEGVELRFAFEESIELIEEKQMFDINKPFTTRDGRDVRVLCTDGPGEWPICGLVSDYDGCVRWNNFGESEEWDGLDLVNKPKGGKHFVVIFKSVGGEELMCAFYTSEERTKYINSWSNSYKVLAKKTVVWTEGDEE